MNKHKQIIPVIGCLFVVFALCFTACTANEQPETAEPVSNDTIPPYINMTQYEFYTETGKPINFSNIGGYDDVDGVLPTRVRGYVDYNTPGDYFPSIVCADLSNNESEVVITIHVVEEGKIPVTTTETPEPTPSACENGEDPNKPCGVVLSNTVRVYKTLYAGEDGKALCESINGEDACEVIYANDGSFWGYGVK